MRWYALVVYLQALYKLLMPKSAKCKSILSNSSHIMLNHCTVVKRVLLVPNNTCNIALNRHPCNRLANKS